MFHEVTVRAVLCVFALLLLAPSAWAQTKVEIGKAFKAAWTHDGRNLSGFRVYLDGSKVGDVPLSVLQAGSASYDLPATLVTTRGSHVLEVSAYNADAESAKASLTFDAVLPAPTVPGSLSIVIQVALNPDGSIGLTWRAQ